jgi:predicted nucleic acid-binding protein
MKVVVDASVAVKWFVAEDEGQVRAARRLLLASCELLAPGLLLTEVANVMWKKLRLGQVTREQGDTVAAAVRGFFAHVEPDDRLVEPAWRLAAEHDHPVYDCVYVALAMRMDARLATLDGRLAALARKSGLGLETITARARRKS